MEPMAKRKWHTNNAVQKEGCDADAWRENEDHITPSYHFHWHYTRCKNVSGISRVKFLSWRRLLESPSGQPIANNLRSLSGPMKWHLAKDWSIAHTDLTTRNQWWLKPSGDGPNSKSDQPLQRCHFSIHRARNGVDIASRIGVRSNWKINKICWNVGHDSCLGCLSR